MADPVNIQVAPGDRPAAFPMGSPVELTGVLIMRPDLGKQPMLNLVMQAPGGKFFLCVLSSDQIRQIATAVQGVSMSKI